MGWCSPGASDSRPPCPVEKAELQGEAKQKQELGNESTVLASKAPVAKVFLRATVWASSMLKIYER